MKGTIVGIIPKSKKDGGTFWNVVVDSADQPGKSFGYNCFDSAITGLEGQVIEFTSTPPKVGTTPILRLAGIMKEPFGGRTATTVHPTASTPSARKEGRNESFAASYSKDIAVAMMPYVASISTHNVEQAKEITDNILNHYFDYFMKKLSGEGTVPF